jgi:DNA-binding PadR family transcriptional regulator
MPASVTLTFTTATLMQSIRNGIAYGFDLMDATGLPSGTVYPALRRLEGAGFIRSHWEEEKRATAEQRPPRKYYRLTPAGEKALESALKRFRLIEQMSPARE